MLIRVAGTIFSAHPKTLVRAPVVFGGGVGAGLLLVLVFLVVFVETGGLGLDRSHEGSRAETRCMVSRLPGAASSCSHQAHAVCVWCSYRTSWACWQSKEGRRGGRGGRQTGRPRRFQSRAWGSPPNQAETRPLERLAGQLVTWAPPAIPCKQAHRPQQRLSKSKPRASRCPAWQGSLRLGNWTERFVSRFAHFHPLARSRRVPLRCTPCRATYDDGTDGLDGPSRLQRRTVETRSSCPSRVGNGWVVWYC